MRYELTKDKFLTNEELEEVLKACKMNPSRDSTLIKFALESGARASEILAVTIKDLDPSQESVYIRPKKAGRARDVYLTSALFKEVYALALNSKKSKPFPITYPRLVQIWNKYRVNEKSFHSLRHTCAVRLYKKTKDIKLVQLFLGHRHMATTSIYTDFQYSVDEMREALGIK